MEQKEERKNSKAPFIISIIISIYFLYRGFHYLQIGYEMKTSGILLTVCGVVLLIISIVMIFKKPKTKDNK